VECLFWGVGNLISGFPNVTAIRDQRWGPAGLRKRYTTGFANRLTP
jgi:hypothetical protein